MGKTTLKTTLFICLLIVSAAPSACLALGHREVLQDGSAFWNNRLWIPETVAPLFGTGGRRSYSLKLHSLEPGSSRKPRLEVQINGVGGSPRLLSGGDRLWIITDDSVGLYKDKEFINYDTGKQLESHGRPFLFDGVPAVIGGGLGDCKLYVFEENKWSMKESYSPPFDDGEDCGGGIYAGGKMYFFAESKGITYYREGLAAKGKEGAGDDWKTLSGDETIVDYTYIGEHPALFMADDTNPFNSKLSGYVIVKGEKRKIYEGVINAFTDALAFEIPGGIMVIAENGFGQPVFSTIKGGKAVSSVKFGQNFPTSAAIYSAFAAMLIFILAFILNAVAGYAAPYWFCTSGALNYSETRIVDKDVFAPQALFKKQFVEMESYIVRKWPDRKAITFSVNAFSGRKTSAAQVNSGVVFFDTGKDGVKATFECRWELASYIMVLAIPVAVWPFTVWILNLDSAAATAGVFAGMFALVFGCLTVITKMFKKWMAEKYNKFISIFLAIAEDDTSEAYEEKPTF